MIGADVYAPGIVKCSGIRLGNKVKILDPHDQPIATGIALMGENEILSLRKGLAIKNISSIYRVPKLRESKYFKEGLIYMQSLPSILTSKILDPNPDDIIIDLTCAPGGKLSHISQLMENNGKIIAVDRNERKISITRDTINRLGCNNIELIIHDSRYFHLDFPKIKADKCIVDPPCSALGITPKLYDFSPRDKILALAKYQKQFLKAASKTVKKGGSVIYSVCTVTLRKSGCRGFSPTGKRRMSQFSSVSWLSQRAVWILLAMATKRIRMQYSPVIRRKTAGERCDEVFL